MISSILSLYRWAILLWASFAAVGGLAGGVILLFVGGARLTKTRAFARIALTDTQDAKSGYTVSSFQKTLWASAVKLKPYYGPVAKF
jgi:hypothetical protein